MLKVIFSFITAKKFYKNMHRLRICQKILIETKGKLMEIR